MLLWLEPIRALKISSEWKQMRKKFRQSEGDIQGLNYTNYLHKQYPKVFANTEQGFESQFS